MVDIVTSDWQLAENPRDSYRFDFIPWLCREIKARKVEEVFMLGDITEQKDYHSASFVNKVVKAFSDIASLCHVTIVEGNHDGTERGKPFFKFLSMHPAIYFVTECTTSLGRGFKFVPYMPDPEDWKRIQWKGVKTKLIMTHNTFAGAYLQRDITADKGIPLSVIPKGVSVISGDVHVPQTTGCVTYVGAPYTVDFGDDYQPRVLIIDGNRHKSINVPGPQKRLIEMDMSDDGTLGILQGKYNEGDILKVRVKLRSDQYVDWLSIKGNIAKWIENDHAIPHMIQPVIDNTKKSRVQFKHRKQHDDPELLKSYGKHRRIAESIVNTGLKLMEG
ncbi:MAG: hypothetical protein L0287_20170 [Anaerolineae bacterium]|nr:hypothetical protein [Anaerolineae bacterium]